MFIPSTTMVSDFRQLTDKFGSFGDFVCYPVKHVSVFHQKSRPKIWRPFAYIPACSTIWSDVSLMVWDADGNAAMDLRCELHGIAKVMGILTWKIFMTGIWYFNNWDSSQTKKKLEE